MASNELPRFLYRGTTRGWPGNDASREENRTCATTDPLVATVFAVHCRNFGAAVVHVFDSRGYQIVESTNCLADIEAEVLVESNPLDFAVAAVRTIEVDEAIEILDGMGFKIPTRLPASAVQLTRFLEVERDRRLQPEQIAEFNRRCGVSDDE
jgi:hypothetical protein